MSAIWHITNGQVGNIIKKDNYFLINIAYNRYVPDGANKSWKKKETIWFNCISDFEPRVDIGDTVIAEGEYISSKNSKNPYNMKINHIGIIKKRSNNGF